MGALRAAFRSPRAVGLACLAVAILAALRLLYFADWDPTVFTAFGEESTDISAYAENKLGREVLVRNAQGHDGKFFFVQAHDPWLLDPEANAQILDRPAYRSQRMLYPLIAGGAGILDSQAIVWALPIVNVIMLAIGSWALARIALSHGAPAWVGVAFALNIGLLSELFIDGAGILAFALAGVGALALEEDRVALAASLFAASALTREVMAVFVAFVALFWLIRKKRVPWLASAPAAVAILAWAGYVQLRIDVPADSDQVRELTAVPFSGLIEALTSGRAEMVDYLVMISFVALMVIVPYRAWRSNVYLTWGAVGFAVMAPFLTVFVWQKSFDISRALAPLLTVFVLELFINRARRSRNFDGRHEETTIRAL